MTKVKHILKDYEESGALHALVNIHAAVDEQTFVTKSGDLVMFLSLRGTDPECLDHSQTDLITRRFESALSIFDDRYRIYQYLFKRDVDRLPHEHYRHPVVEEAVLNRVKHLRSKSGAFYSIETYLAIVCEGPRSGRDLAGKIRRFTLHPKAAIRGTFSAERATANLDGEIERMREGLAGKVGSFVHQLRDTLVVEQLDIQDAFTVLRRLLNYAPYKEDVPLRQDGVIDFQACDSFLECHRDHLRLDDYYVQVLTLKEPPSRTFAHLLHGLAQIPCNLVVASEWKRQSPLQVRRLIQSKRRHFHNSKTSLGSYLNSGSQTRPQDHLVDDGAVALVGDLGACLEEIEIRGRYFGEFSMTVILYNKDWAALRAGVSECFKTFAAHDAHMIEERYNLLNAWLAVLPGNSSHNLRKLWLLNTNYADLSLLFTPEGGSVRNEQLGTEYLAVLETAGGTPYFFNFHHKDVAHTLVLGATGSGKSFLLNFLLTHLQKYEPATFIFDLGGSYESLTRLFDGSYLRVAGSERQFTINPFCLPPTRENLQFLFTFVKVLIESSAYRMNATDDQDLFEQIENLYEVAEDQRRLLTLSNIVNRNLRAQLQRWVSGGPHASLFDNVQDNLTFAPFQTFDFEGMDRVPDQLEPLLFFILHRANVAIHDCLRPTLFKAFVMDEAWRFFRHPAIKLYIVEALKTWRKKNAAMILATQSIEDLSSSGMLPVVLESCPTKLFLANPDMDQDACRGLFHLNETEAAAIAGLLPKQEFLLKRPDFAKRLRLTVDPKGYWLYTNNPQDNHARREAFTRHGFREGLEILAGRTS